MKLGYSLYIYVGDLFWILIKEHWYVSLIQNESYQQSPEKTKNNSEHGRQYQYFSILISFTNAIDLYSEARNIYLQGFLIKNYVVWAEFPIGSFHFPQWKVFFPIDW